MKMFLGHGHPVEFSTTSVAIESDFYVRVPVIFVLRTLLWLSCILSSTWVMLVPHIFHESKVDGGIVQRH